MLKIVLQTLPVLVFSYTAQVLMKKGASSLSRISGDKMTASPFQILGLMVLNWQIRLGFFLAGIGALGFLVLPLISWLA